MSAALPAAAASRTAPSAYCWPRTGTPRARLWAAMRVLKRFGFVELRLAADVSQARAQDFLRIMTRAGYLIRVDKAFSPPVWSQGERKWGPLPPRVEYLRVANRPVMRVTDRNTAEVVDVPQRPHGPDRAVPTADGGVS